MAELLSEVEYGRILGSFTAVAEDFGDTVAPDAIPLTGTVTFYPSQSHVSYVNLAGETASLYIPPISASIVNGRIIGSDGNDGVVLLASNSNNVSSSVLWTARIRINPINSGDPAPADHDFLIEVRRGEIASLIDVIKATSRVHNIALFHDAIAEAAAAFWARVESGEFRGNQGPPGPAGVGVGVPGPLGRPGIMGKDGDPGVGGNLIPDGDLERPGFLVSGDYQESSDAVSGSKAVRLSNATSRRIRLEPDTSYVGTVYLKSAEATAVNISRRVFGAEGDIDRVIEDSYQIPANTWQRVTFLLDSNVGDQSMEIIVTTDGRTISADLFTLSDNSVVKGLQKELTAAKAQLEAAMAQLDRDLEDVDADKERLAVSLNDLAVVLEGADVDLTELNTELEDLKNDLITEETRRQEADAAAQVILDQLDTNLAEAKQELVDNKIILETLDTDLATTKAELLVSAQSITKLETETLPELKRVLEEANTAAIQELAALDDKLYGAAGDITAAKASIAQLTADLTAEAQTRAQLALDLQADFEERDTRLAQAEDILSAAFPDGAVNVPEELSRTIRDSVVQYAVSDSAETPPTTGWSPAAPSKDPGQYIWFRTLITYGDNSTSPSSAALLTGNTGPSGPQGPPGEDGNDGTGVTILGSRASEAQLPTTGTDGDAYLVGGYLYVWSSGSWSNVGLIRGPQGVPGPAGKDGEPRFTWVKYASSASGAEISDDPAGKSYIGLAYNKPTAVESNTPGDYQWALIQGPQGVAGGTGPQGIGISNITPYYRDVVRGAAAPAVPTTATPSGWATSEPTWVPNRDLYRVEKITYTNGTFSYTAVTKIAAYAGIDAAMAAANGKNLNTYTDLAPASKPGPAPANNSARTVGDIHRNRNSATGEIWAEYQWTGSAWKAVSFGDEVLSSLDVGKVTGGTGAFQQFFADKLIADNATITKLWTDQLVGKTAAFNQISVAAGNILVDPNGLDPTLRARVGGASWSWDGVGKYWKAPSINGGTTQYNAFVSIDSVYDSNLIDPGAMYVIKYDIWVDKVASNTVGRAAIYYRKKDGSTSFVGDGTEDGGDTDSGDTITAGEWTTVERFWRAPNDAQSGGICFQILYGATGSTEVRIRNPFVGKQAPAVLIEDGAISAQKVNAESVGAAVGKFIKLETSQLVATDSIKTPEAVIDKIWADGISAKTITTSRLTVAPGNLFPDPYFKDVEGWSTNPNTSIVTSANPAENVFRVNTLATQTGVYLRTISSDPWVLKPGTTYIVRLEAKFTGGGATRLGVYANGISDVGGNVVNSATIIRKSEATWDSYEATLTTSANATGVFRPGLYTIPPFTAGGTIEVRKIEVLPMVGSVLIENGAVNASKINAESVGAAVGEFVKLDVKNLTASSANIDSLVAQRIAAGTAAFQTVNADKIIASTATMDSAVINQIWADGIAAKTITTNKLTVATGNLVPDGDEMVTDVQWGGMVRSTTDKPGQTIASRTQIAGTGGGASIGNEAFPVTPGQEYSVQMWIKASKPNSRFYMELRDATTGGHAGTGTLIEPEAKGTASYVLFNSQLVPDVWTLFRGTWVPNPGVSSVRFGTFYFNHTSGTERNADISIAGLSIKPKVGAVLIENGAVSANHIKADSIDTDHLRTNAVSAAKIVAGAVTTEKMTANSIDGDRIRANTLDAGKITANTITATQILGRTITAAQIKTRTLLAENIVSGTITANEIKAKTITAAEIKAGAIEAEHLNVSGEFIGNMISGEHIYGTVVEGGEIRTDSTGGGQVTLSNTSYTNSWNGLSGPGIRVTPIITTDTVIPPGIGPEGRGIWVDGGKDTSGTASHISARPTDVAMVTEGPSGDGVVSASSTASVMRTTGVGGEIGVVQTTATASLMRTTGVGGGYGSVETSADRSSVRTRSGNGAESGWVRAQPKDVELSYVDANNTYFSRIRADANEAFLFTRAGGAERYLSVDKDGVWVKTNRSGVWELTNLEGGAWTNLTFVNGWSAYSGGGGYYNGLRARRTPSGIQIQGMAKGGNSGTTVARLPAGLRPPYASTFPGQIAGGTAQCSVSIDSGAMALRYNDGPNNPGFVSFDVNLPLN